MTFIYLSGLQFCFRNRLFNLRLTSVKETEAANWSWEWKTTWMANLVLCSMLKTLLFPLLPHQTPSHKSAAATSSLGSFTFASAPVVPSAFYTPPGKGLLLLSGCVTSIFGPCATLSVGHWNIHFACHAFSSEEAVENLVWHFPGELWPWRQLWREMGNPGPVLEVAGLWASVEALPVAPLRPQVDQATGDHDPNVSIWLLAMIFLCCAS